MSQTDNFLHTTHRTVSWFKKTWANDELVLKAPFQRNPVWTDIQKAYLIETILHGLPIPELYMQDTGNEDGDEKHIVVDGQQRIRAVLDYLTGKFNLDGDDITPGWSGRAFEELSAAEKKAIFNYKFVVRVLPDMDDESLRKIFTRLNRNVVSLNPQELRNATYWGPFIRTIQNIADNQPFWADSGLFSANDHRRMLDHEFISEIAVAYLHGPQNKKDKLDQTYQLYEETFEDKEKLVHTFSTVTSEISAILPDLNKTRRKKKSDFYTLFLCFCDKHSDLPLSKDERENVREKIISFGQKVDDISRLDEEELEARDPQVVSYYKAVSRAASDRSSRINRSTAFKSYVFEE
ncbi:DUF262 domain-containing protein [Pseudomonas aeruginosa]|uniref:DUF262 domain-containing protein n=1 Tax=Pseudomonas aeruginosa TaxID=287 RepID=UPI00106B116F|nr:DUF262 domain-containing protein [Pseudomonas aeruginosa]